MSKTIHTPRQGSLEFFKPFTPEWDERLGYKVVQRKRYAPAGTGLRSMCMNTSFPEEMRVDYAPGQVSFPRVAGSRLFFFLDLEVAKAFFRTHAACCELWGEGAMELWSCRFDREVEEFRPLRLELLRDWYTRSSLVGDTPTWADLVASGESQILLDAPAPTTRAIQLVEAIK